MKKALLALIGAGVVASVASLAVAQDAAVANSANAVGVVKYTVPADAQLTCIALPLNPMDAGEWTWTDTSLAEQLPNNSTVYFWDGMAWQSSTKGKRGWDGAGASKVLQPGEAFFVQGPNGGEELQVSLLGELPTDESLSYSVRGSGNLDTRIVNMYPTEVAFTNSALAGGLVNNSTVYFWDGTAWQSSTKGKRGWDGYGYSHLATVGEGVFVQSADTSSTEIETQRPFEW